MPEGGPLLRTPMPPPRPPAPPHPPPSRRHGPAVRAAPAPPSRSLRFFAGRA